MSVLSAYYRYRIPLLLLSISVIALLLLSNQPAKSQRVPILNQQDTQANLVVKNTKIPAVTEKVHKTVLENGLTVLIKELHTAPVVSVQVWYKFGSRNEEPGVNGIAHQLEHLMFKGTKSRPIQFGRLFSVLGSDSNAFTSYDQTAYYNTVERDKLKALLVLEADRMQNALIDTEHLANEKRVVISELQGYENSPEYRLNRAVMQAAFSHHPYGLPVGGTKADVEKFQVEQVRKYYQQFYTPDNAVLVIVGDFSATQTLDTVKEIFGKIPKKVKSEEFVGTYSQEWEVEEKNNKVLASKNSIVLREQGAGALLQAVYPLPDVNQPDIPALSVMDYILTEGRNSRLYQRLVESGLASEISGSVATLREFGWYELSVTAAPEQDLKKIDSALTSAIASVVEKGVTLEELARAKTQVEAAVILGNRDITSQAMQLGNDETSAGDYRYTDRYLAAVREVTTADVEDVIKKYLKKEARTVGFFEPIPNQVKQIGNKPKLPQAKENLSAGAPIALSEVTKYLPEVDLLTDTFKGSSGGKISLKSPEKFKLANGLQVILLPDTSTPTVTLSGYVKAGTEFDPDDQAGLASLVAESLLSGTKNKDATTLAKALEERGASLDFSAYTEGVTIEGNSLAGDLPVIIHTLADALQNSSFPRRELELNRQQALTALEMELDDPSEVAKRTFLQAIYPQKHPLHIFPSKQSLRKIKRQDAIAFKEKYYRPETTVLTLVGDFDPYQVRSLITKEFEDWQVSGQTPILKYPSVAIPDSLVRVNSVIPGKAQAFTYLGNISIQRQDPRYYAALVLNQILGGDTLSSRLGAEVRDRQGLTYGIYSDFEAGKNAGTFFVEMQTSPEDVEEAIASTRKLIEQIHQQGVTLLEVETAKRTLISNHNISLANPEELTDKILMNRVYGFKDSELYSFGEKIQQVTLAQVNQAARELLHPDKIVVVTAGPAILADQSAK